MNYFSICVFLLFSWFSSTIARLPSVQIDVGNHHHKREERWAILISGSTGFTSYRHQANICHAYHMLKEGGYKDSHIIVFMYDDIAWDKQNPNPGVIINNPNGNNVYQGVPKDYTGKHVNAFNFYAVILGKTEFLTGGSGKVVKSGPNDHIFIYISSHGYSGGLVMPNRHQDITAEVFIGVLQKKFHSRSYKRMVIYVEACHSGSMFDGLLPENINIYAMTSANPFEDSWAMYCPLVDLPYYLNYNTCLADVFSLAWMEDSERHDWDNETLQQQYEAVSKRVNEYPYETSHVMQYGDKEIAKDLISLYMTSPPTSNRAVNQVTLIHFFLVISAVYLLKVSYEEIA